MKITGKCLCGAVRWESSEAPIVTRWCWCRDCQYLGAGSGTANACFRTATFTVTGTMSDYVSIADSGNRMHRRFCPVCATPALQRGGSHGRTSSSSASGPSTIRTSRKPAMTIWTVERAELGVHQ